jgi:hypothetical protein
VDRFEHVTDETLRRLLAYWLELRNGRAMPARQDLDPARIAFALPMIWLYDYEPPTDFRRRIAGEQIIDLWGKSPRGRLMRDIFKASYGGRAVKSLMVIVRTRQIMHSTADVITTRGVRLQGERIAMPLSSDGVRVDAILGATVYDWGSDRTKSGLFENEAVLITYTGTGEPEPT